MGDREKDRELVPGTSAQSARTSQGRRGAPARRRHGVSDGRPVAAQSPAATAPDDFSGVTLRLWSGSTTAAARPRTPPPSGTRLTGGTVIVRGVPFAERAHQVRRASSRPRTPASTCCMSPATSPAASATGCTMTSATRRWASTPSVFVPAIIPILTSDGGLRGLPLHSEMLIYIYNKTMFEAAGLDPESPARHVGGAVRRRGGSDRRHPVPVPGPVAGGLRRRRLLPAVPQQHPGRQAAVRRPDAGPVRRRERPAGVPDHRGRHAGRLLRPQPRRPTRRTTPSAPNFNDGADGIADQLRRAVGLRCRRQPDRLPDHPRSRGSRRDASCRASRRARAARSTASRASGSTSSAARRTAALALPRTT